ncbi:tetratricopeptide repeat protein [Litoribacter ruber]|uniref:tetratricopeptide repeat protein n=1 Tax=Litoribacter ruber TaxID=702568 RepID=UPI001BD9197D|nr:tetratricopeptide repeat protein [Litoribacter ruber]MBT0810418.1 tetratricopeptide repeat protein [Litoribacter ruber]
MCFLSLAQVSFAQEVEIEVDAEDREKAIRLTDQGISQIERGNYPAAIRDIEDAISIDSTFHPAYINLYSAYINTQGDKSNLIKLLEKGNRVFREDDELTYYLGYVYYEKNELEKAIELFSEAIRYSKINGEDFPLVYAYHFNRGNAHLKLARYQKAVEDFSYALKLNPDHPDILVNKGISHYRLDQKSQACRDWRKSVEEGSDTATKYINQFCR